MFNRDFLVRAFELGFDRLAFNGGYSVLLATGPKGLMVFMPVRGNDENQHLAKLGILQPKQEEKNMAQENRTAPATTQQPEQKQTPKEPTAATTAQKPDNGTSVKPFQPANGAGINGSGAFTPDPFDELAKSIAEIRIYAKGFADMLAGLQRKVYDAQRAVKQRERDFRSTREILDKLKNASGF